MPELVETFGGQLGSLSTQLVERVYCHHADSECIGQDKQSRTLRQMLGIEHTGRVEEVGYGLYPDYPNPSENRIVDPVARCQISCMGTGSCAPVRHPGRPQDNDGLVPRKTPRRAYELLDVTDALLHVDHNASRVGIVSEEIDEVPRSTSIMEPREANMLRPRWVSMPHSRSARPNAPLWEMKATLPERGLDVKGVVFRPICGLIKPRQFGPTILIGISLPDPRNLFLAPLTFFTGLPEAGRDDDDTFHPCLFRTPRRLTGRSARGWQ